MVSFFTHFFSNPPSQPALTDQGDWIETEQQRHVGDLAQSALTELATFLEQSNEKPQQVAFNCRGLTLLKADWKWPASREKSDPQATLLRPDWKFDPDIPATWAEAKKQVPLLEKFLIDAERDYKTDLEVSILRSRLCIALGRFYLSQGDYKKAGELFRETLLLNRQFFWNHEPSISDILITLGDLSTEERDFDKARVFYKEALSLLEMEDDPTLRTKCLYGLAVIAFFTEEYKEALAKFQLASQKLDKSDILSIKIEIYLARIHRNIDNYDSALLLFQSAQTKLIEKYGKEHPLYAHLLMFYAECLWNKEHSPLAHQMCLEAINISTALFGENHPYTGGGDILNWVN